MGKSFGVPARRAGDWLLRSSGDAQVGWIIRRRVLDWWFVAGLVYGLMLVRVGRHGLTRPQPAFVRWGLLPRGFLPCARLASACSDL